MVFMVLFAPKTHLWFVSLHVDKIHVNRVLSQNINTNPEQIRK